MSRRTIAAFAAAFVALGFGFVPAQSSAATNVLFILDSSGSMWERVDGVPKTLTAKRALDQTLGSLPADTHVGLMTYGARHKGDCADIQLLSPIGSDTRAAITRKVNALAPKGSTPIAETLRQSAHAFDGLKGQANSIVLITDGIEECHGDPCAAARELKAAELDLKVDIIGFGLNEAQGKVISCVTQTTGGKYYAADNVRAFTAALTEVRQEVAAAAVPQAAAPPPAPPPPVKQAEHLYGTPIHGGDAFDSAVALQPGTQYRLDYDQPAERQDFFKVPARGGQQIRVTLTGGNTNTIQTEMENGQRQRIAGPAGAGQRGQTIITHDFAYGQDGTYYVLIESAGYGGHVGPDCTFQIDLVDQFDANINRDAGGDESTAIRIQEGYYPRSNMNDADTMDVYFFTADPAKVYQFKTRPANDSATLVLTAVDSDGNKLGEGRSPSAGVAASIANLKLAKAGPIYLKVSFDRNYGQPAGDYSMVLGTGDVPSPPKPPPR